MNERHVAFRNIALTAVAALAFVAESALRVTTPRSIWRAF